MGRDAGGGHGVVDGGDLERLIQGRVLYHEPLAKYTSWRMGGPADIVVFPASRDDVRQALIFATRAGLPVVVLGGGSNTLVRDGGIRGLVLVLDGTFLELGAEGTHVRAGAGVRLSRLVAFCSKAGLTGVECLAGVPGTVGGAIRGNAGAFGGSIADRLERVWCIVSKGEEVIFERNEIEFTYRRSSIPADAVVVAGAFALRREDPAAIRRVVSDHLIRRNRSQPVEWRSAGSVFKNPSGDFAGRLIEQVGLKGARVGEAMVSPKHGNFIVNLGGATAQDVLELIEFVRARVRVETAVELELEVQVVGEA